MGSWALQLDGIDDHLNFSTWQETGDFTVSGEVDIIGASNPWLSNGNNNYIEEDGSGNFRLRIDTGLAHTISLEGLTGRNTFSISRTGSTVSYDIGNGAVTGSVTDSGTFTLLEMGRKTSTYYSGKFYGIWTLDGATAGETVWNLDTNSHGTGTVVLVDTVGSRNATAQNMPTDGSAWVYLATKASNESQVGYFNSQSGLTKYQFNEAAAGYYKTVASTNSYQFNDTLFAAQQAEAFTGLSPVDWRNL